MTSGLPPLGDFFAFRAADPAETDRLAGRIEDEHVFTTVARWGTWLVAVRALPFEASADALIPAPGLVVLDGRRRLAAEDTACQRQVDGSLAGRDIGALPGDVTLLRFEADGALTAIRSPSGRVPILWHKSARCCAASSGIGHMARYVPDCAQPDELALATWTRGLGFTPEHRTVLERVRVLEVGHRATFSPRSIVPRFSRFWWPGLAHVPRPTVETTNRHVKELHDILITYLSEETPEIGSSLLSLSGGVDSTALAALLARHLSRDVATISNLPAWPPTLLDRELDFIRPLLADLGIGKSVFNHIHDGVLSAPADNADERPVLPVVHPSLLCLPALVARWGPAVYLGGEFADETCGSFLSIHDWNEQASMRDVVTASLSGGIVDRRWAGRLVKDRLRARLRRAITAFPPLDELDPDLDARYTRWRSDRRSRLNAAPVANRHLLERIPIGQSWLDANWEVCSVLGVRRAYPFVNREILELATRCHPTELIGAKTKLLLRRALHGLVPDRNLYRGDKGSWVLGPTER